MTTNRLAKSAEQTPKRTAQEWCDIGNDRLAGRIPYSDGRFEVREHLHWYVENGQPKLGAKLNYRPRNSDRHKHVMDRDRSNFGIEDWAELNEYLESQGSKVRYSPEGKKLAAA